LQFKFNIIILDVSVTIFNILTLSLTIFIKFILYLTDQKYTI
jgi:hypothetical protein